MNIELNVNGFEFEAVFTEQEIKDIYIPLLMKLKDLREEKGERVIVFLAAPPAVGKSTLTIFLEKLSNEIKESIPIQNLSLDGFHFPNEYLKENKIIVEGKEQCLYDIKGMPETFDYIKFKDYLEKIKTGNIKWPIYDRNLHDIVMDKIDVEAEIILIEGNWLLLDEDGWRDLIKLCDYSIFIESSENVLKNRLINRKIRGGMSDKDALEFYKRCDGKNVHRVLSKHHEADLVLKMLENGEKIKIKEEQK
jgi:pantothenate kinase